MPSFTGVWIVLWAESPARIVLNTLKPAYCT